MCTEMSQGNPLIWTLSWVNVHDDDDDNDNNKQSLCI